MAQRRGDALIDGVLAVVLAAVVAFPFAARAAADDPGAALAGAGGAAAELAPLRRSPAGDLRPLPVFAEGGRALAAVDAGAIRDPAALRSAVVDAGGAVMGPDAAEALAALAEATEPYLPITTETEDDGFTPAYPYRWPEIERVLAGLTIEGGPPEEALSDAVSDLGALYALAATNFIAEFPNAGPIAYALLERARADGRCESQLNLAVVVMADVPAQPGPAIEEIDGAVRRCGDDPTPRWLRGEYLAQVALGFRGETRAEVEEASSAYRDDAIAAFRALQDTHPGSSAGWAGEADVELIDAYAVSGVSPFLARQHFRRALVLLVRAADLSEDPDIYLGVARAHAGLGRHDEAVTALERALGAAPGRAVLSLRLAEQLEHTGDFARAAAVAGDVLDGTTTLPDGSTVVPAAHSFSEPVADEDGPGRLTLRGSTDVEASFPIAGAGGEGAGGLADLSFLPAFRDVPGVTGHDRWCPAWTMARDLILAGEPARALKLVPADGFFDVRPTSGGYQGVCVGAPVAEDAALLAAVASVEAGDDVSAGGPSLPAVHDARQELWRFAGDLDKAAAAAAAWREAAPGDPRARDRAGEIEYLGGNLDAAAEHFERAVDAATGRVETEGGHADELIEAEALLKLGTVRELAGALREARAPLVKADTLASSLLERQQRAARAIESASFDEAFNEDIDPEALADFEIDGATAAYISYNARAQLGDAALRGRRYEDAADAYASAHEREDDLPPSGSTRLTRPEVLDNNEALVLIQLDRPREGLAAATAAVRADPANPLFLENQAFALRRLGRFDAAVPVLERALESDPTLYTAANDLAVIRARQERFTEAAAILRAALEAEPGYALGTFNLGVVLERRGPGHMLEAQGLLGAAVEADRDLRDADRVPTFDDEPFFTTLDLSKPLPTDWHFADSTRRTTVVLAGTVALLVLAQLGTAAFQEMASDTVQDRALESRERRRRRRLPSWIAVGVTFGVFLYPLARSRGSTTTEYVGVGLGVLAIAALYLRVRRWARRRYPVVVAEYTWAPTAVIGVAATMAGFGFAPLPVAEEEGPTPVSWIHAAGPASLAAVSAVLLGLAALTHVPLTHALGVAALVMTASTLVPVRPLDGGVVAGDRVRKLTIDAVMVALAILLAFGVL